MLVIFFLFSLFLSSYLKIEATSSAPFAPIISLNEVVNLSCQLRGHYIAPAPFYAFIISGTHCGERDSTIRCKIASPNINVGNRDLF